MIEDIGKKLEDDSLFDTETVKKYAVPTALVIGGLMIIGKGAFLGVATIGSTWILLNRLKEGQPAIYNWILDHTAFVDIVVTLGLTMVCGTTVMGLVAAIIGGLANSIMLDYIKDYQGKVEGVESITFSQIIVIIKNKLNGSKTKEDPKGEYDEEINDGKEEKPAVA